MKKINCESCHKRIHQWEEHLNQITKDKYCDYCRASDGTLKTYNKTTKTIAYTDEIRQKAREMQKDGLSYRVIARELGIDHPQKVKRMIEAKTI